jgi:hypothetical protein
VGRGERRVTVKYVDAEEEENKRVSCSLQDPTCKKREVEEKTLLARPIKRWKA